MKPPNTTSRSASSSASGKTHQGRRRFYRLDNWLSEADANFLLKKKALWSAKQGQYEMSIVLFDRLIAFEPNAAEHYVNRGLVRACQQQWSQALADYDRAIELDPSLDKAYSNRANVYAKHQEWASAISDYDEAIDLNPLNLRARINQAITFREMDNTEEALICLDIALFFYPNSAAAHAERGRTHHVVGNWNCAIAEYRTALKLATTTADKPQDAKLVGRVKQWMATL